MPDTDLTLPSIDVLPLRVLLLEREFQGKKNPSFCRYGTLRILIGFVIADNRTMASVVCILYRGGRDISRYAVVSSGVVKAEVVEGGVKQQRMDLAYIEQFSRP